MAKVALRKAKPAGQYQYVSSAACSRSEQMSCFRLLLLCLTPKTTYSNIWFYRIKPDEVQSFLGGLKVDDLPGVAYSTAGKLEEIGVKFVNDIRQTSKERLISALGPKTGEKLWDYARGIDRTDVGEQPIRKSVSAEINWGIRFINQEEAEEFVFNLCKELEKRLLNEQVKGKQLTMKIMRRSLDAPLDPPKHLGHGKCDTFNKSISFGVATHDYQILGKEAVSILRSYNFSPGDLRGLGVQLTKLEPIKASLSGPDGSQRKLNFGSLKTSGLTKTPGQDPIQDASGGDQPLNSPQGRHITPDPIVDGPVTPRKPKTQGPHPALRIAQAGEKDTKARLPLNISGTQFILPSNTDPAVLAELPHDIRSKLMAQGRSRSSSEARDDVSTKSRTQSPAPTEIPPEFDPEVFHALPEDMKAEILRSYRLQSKQTLLPQSPRKDRMIQLSKKTTPTKRRGRSSKEKLADANAKIVQTNLLSRKHQAEGAELEEIEELDEAFLAELPEEVRNEVVADYRRRKAQRSSLDLRINPKRNQNGGANDPLPGGQTRLHFPSRPPKITFPGSRMTSLIEIRDMLNVWYSETSKDGPHQEDVQVFEEYLGKVIVEERDMDKVQKLVRWLDFLIEEDEAEDQPERAAWRAIVKDIKEEVQKAVRSRGLGPLDLG